MLHNVTLVTCSTCAGILTNLFSLSIPTVWCLLNIERKNLPADSPPVPPFSCPDSSPVFSLAEPFSGCGISVAEFLFPCPDFTRFSSFRYWGPATYHQNEERKLAQRIQSNKVPVLALGAMAVQTSRGNKQQGPLQTWHANVGVICQYRRRYSSALQRDDEKT